VTSPDVVPLPSTASWAVPLPPDLISGAYRMARTSELVLPTIDQTFSPTSTTTSNQKDGSKVKDDPMSSMVNGRRAPIAQAFQFGIFLNDIESAIPNEVKGRDLITMGILQQSLLNTGIASSMITYPVAVEFISSRDEAYGGHDKRDATARVYPLGDRELSWLHHRYRNPSPAVAVSRYFLTPRSTSSSINKYRKHQHRKSGDRTCNIPFYHLTMTNKDQYPAGHRVIFNEKLEHGEVHSYGVNEKETVEALIISSTVIVTLKPLSVLIMDHLPSHMTPLLSCILQYLPTINTWTDAVDVSTLGMIHTFSTRFVL
jgi:hypothetical protein